MGSPPCAGAHGRNCRWHRMRSSERRRAALEGWGPALTRSQTALERRLPAALSGRRMSMTASPPRHDRPASHSAEPRQWHPAGGVFICLAPCTQRAQDTGRRLSLRHGSRQGPSQQRSRPRQPPSGGVLIPPFVPSLRQRNQRRSHQNMCGTILPGVWSGAGWPRRCLLPESTRPAGKLAVFL
jgi:hypothetical protein